MMISSISIGDGKKWRGDIHLPNSYPSSKVDESPGSWDVMKAIPKMSKISLMLFSIFPRGTTEIHQSKCVMFIDFWCHKIHPKVRFVL